MSREYKVPEITSVVVDINIYLYGKVYNKCITIPVPTEDILANGGDTGTIYFKKLNLSEPQKDEE